MVTFYDPENKRYSRLVPIWEAQEMKEKTERLEERLKNTPVNPEPTCTSEEELCIDDIDELKKLVEGKNFSINMPVNRRRATLFLTACYFCSEKEPLEFLIEKGSDVNRTDIFGYNAIMSVILNENMPDEVKLEVIQMLIDKGADVNWLNIQGETALLLALQRVDVDIANLLLDNGAFLYKD